MIDGRPKRQLLFVVNDAKYFLSHRLAIAVEARRQGFDVHVAAPEPQPQALADEGITYHSIHLPRGKAGPIDAARSILSLIRLFNALKPDLVHAVTTKPVVYGGIAARLARVPAVVFAVAGLGPGFRGSATSPSVRFALRLLYGLALGHRRSIVIFQNQDDLGLLQRETGLAQERVRLIRGSGVDLQQYSVLPEPSEPLVVLMASRLVKDKGPEQFVAAARLLRGRGHSAVRFVLAGEPDPHSPGSIPRRVLDEWRSEGVVELLGYRNDVPDLIAASHVVVLPSTYGEGLPKILVEAAARGRAVVTTDHPGCRDAVLPGESALLVPGGDVPALADAIERLLVDSDMRRRLGAAGRQLAEREFGIDRIVALHMEAYGALIEPSPPPSDTGQG